MFRSLPEGTNVDIQTLRLIDCIGLGARSVKTLLNSSDMTSTGILNLE